MKRKQVCPTVDCRCIFILFHIYYMYLFHHVLTGATSSLHTFNFELAWLILIFVCVFQVKEGQE